MGRVQNLYAYVEHIERSATCAILKDLKTSLLHFACIPKVQSLKWNTVKSLAVPQSQLSSLMHISLVTTCEK